MRSRASLARLILKTLCDERCIALIFEVMQEVYDIRLLIVHF